LTPRFRGVPKKVAQFGEDQFNETGAQRVDVLRVKASTMRKHFKQLRGITYLVGVISLDRVRVYFFDSHGRLLVGENLDPSDYEKVQKQSRLLTSYEKPTPPTEEELRMEATEETRNMLSKAIRKVSRELAQSEPEFPELYVTAEETSDESQNFGMTFEEDGALIFEESAVRTEWAEGVCLRAAFLLLVDSTKRDIPFVQCIGNGIAFSHIGTKKKESWFEKWMKISKDSRFLPLLNHLVRHTQAYSTGGFETILEMIRNAPQDVTLKLWLEGLETIHDYVEVPLETGDYHVIRRFCQRIGDVSALRKRKDVLPKVHLGARAICNPKPLDLPLSMTDGEEDSESDCWLSVQYIHGNQVKTLTAGAFEGKPVDSVTYLLNIDDLTPKPGGIQPRMKDIVRWALSRLGLQSGWDGTFKKSIVFEDKELGTTESAVLERLMTGDEKILSNTLLGSPETVRTLVETGCMILLPSFNHLGIRPNYLLKGNPEEIQNLVESCALEATVFISEGMAYSVVSCPAAYGREMVSRSIDLEKSEIYPLAGVSSNQRILRDETIYRTDANWFSWAFTDF
jgi:hypothetical protein